MGCTNPPIPTRIIPSAPNFGSNVTRGTYAGAPAGASDGDVHYTNDSGGIVRFFFGGVWIDMRPGITSEGLVVPVLADYAWVNQGPATDTQAGGLVRLKTTPVVGLDVHHFLDTVPATPWTYRSMIHYCGGELRTVGLCIRESATGTFYRFGFGMSAADESITIYFNTSNVGGSTRLDTLFQYLQAPVMFGISDDGVGGDLTFFVEGPTGEPVILLKEARNLRFTTGPDQFGWHIASTTFDVTLDIYHSDIG